MLPSLIHIVSHCPGSLLFFLTPLLIVPKRPVNFTINSGISCLFVEPCEVASYAFQGSDLIDFYHILDALHLRLSDWGSNSIT